MHTHTQISAGLGPGCPAWREVAMTNKESKTIHAVSVPVLQMQLNGACRHDRREMPAVWLAESAHAHVFTRTCVNTYVCV